jgi:hypothetical protein
MLSRLISGSHCRNSQISLRACSFRAAVKAQAGGLTGEVRPAINPNGQTHPDLRKQQDAQHAPGG